MKTIIKPMLLVMMATFSSASIADAVLGVKCAADVANKARVLINGADKGACPTTLSLPPGMIDLQVVLSVDAEHERRYETRVELPDNAAKQIDVELSAPQLTAAAQAAREAAAKRLAQQGAMEQLRAAEAGHIAAMRAVSERYLAGNGLNKDIAKSQFWRNRADVEEARPVIQAAERGEVKAMHDLAHLYDIGKGVAKDAAKAEEWRFRADAKEAESVIAAAQAGDITAMRRLADRFDAGNGVLKDAAKAAAWRSRADAKEIEPVIAAAQAGDPKAMQALAQRYTVGKGVAKDPVKAAQWQANAEAAQQRQAEAERATKRRAEVERELADIRYFGFLTDSMQKKPNREMSEIMTWAFTTSPMMLVSDLLSAPSRSIKEWQLKRELKALQARPAAWANPESMIAKAIRQGDQVAKH